MLCTKSWDKTQKSKGVTLATMRSERFKPLGEGSRQSC
jgi:hypothetical protein